MNTLLVPTDFSENAEKALYYAIELAKGEPAKIILLNAFSINEEDMAGQVLIGQQKAEERLKALATKIAHAGGIPYETISREGSPVKVILDVIEKRNISMVIMGTKGESNFAKVFFGSNTAQVIAKARCPVLAIPHETVFAPIKRITYATNYQNSDIPALKRVADLARPYQAQINILHIANEDEVPSEEVRLMDTFRNIVEEKVDYNNISFQMLAGKDVEQELKEYLDANSTDMLVMSTHNREGLWEKLFGSSLTNEMAYKSPVPLMAFHYNKEAAVKLI
jgi:nucleotide-binding universal stress UspA family protein